MKLSQTIFKDDDDNDDEDEDVDVGDNGALAQHRVKRPSEEGGEKPSTENDVEQNWTEKIKIVYLKNSYECQMNVK